MKHFFTLIAGLALLFPLVPIHAKQIGAPEALRLATQFQAQRSPQGLRSASTPVRVLRSGAGLRSASDEAPVYLYNFGNNKGFVVISGDDAAKPILGYSDTGTLNAEKLPSGLEDLLDAYERGIDSLRLSAGTSLRAASSTETQIAPVAPMTSNIRYGQDAPFNLLCPYDNQQQQRTLTGCVATAMAELMRFHRWPLKGTGNHTYVENNYGSLSVDFSQATYDWNTIQDAYNSSSSNESMNAVATLMYHCGVSVNMDYSTQSSSATLEDAGAALVRYFGYDSNLQYRWRNLYTDVEWKTLILKELRAGRPVLYSGTTSTNSGHAFLCDGCDTDGFFHINWGWDGSSNGYFELTSLANDSPLTTGATGGFSVFQHFISGIQKEDGIDRPSYEIGMNSGIYSGLTSTKSSINVNTGTFGANPTVMNYGANTFVGKLGIGYLNASGAIVKLTSTTVSYSIGSYAGGSIPALTVSLKGLAAGNYRLYEIYQPQDSTGWSLVRPSKTAVNYLNVSIAGSTATISNGSNAPVLSLSRSIEPVSAVYLGKEAGFDVTVKNTGADYSSYFNLYLYSETDTSAHQVLAQDVVYCPSGQTSTFHFSGLAQVKPGPYRLLVRYDNSNSYAQQSWTNLTPTDSNAVRVNVLATPSRATLVLDSAVSLQPGRSMTKGQAFSLEASLTNRGGFCDSRLYVLIQPLSGSGATSMVNSGYLFLDSLGSKRVTIQGTLDLEPGEYYLKLYYQANGGWVPVAPTSLDTMHFSITQPTETTTVDPTTDMFLKSSGSTLTLVTDVTVQRLRLYSVSGKLLQTVVGEKMLSIGALPKGLYLIEVEYPGGIRCLKYVHS
jgi:hypothetical protein